MKVLITNIWLEGRGGTEMYVRDLAIALHNRNISVEVYSPILGSVAEEIRRAGINVANSIDALHNIPDIIHAHHYIPSIEVLIKFPNVPAIYILHDRTHSVDT